MSPQVVIVTFAVLRAAISLPSDNSMGFLWLWHYAKRTGQNTGNENKPSALGSLAGSVLTRILCHAGCLCACQQCYS